MCAPRTLAPPPPLRPRHLPCRWLRRTPSRLGFRRLRQACGAVQHGRRRKDPPVPATESKDQLACASSSPERKCPCLWRRIGRLGVQLGSHRGHYGWHCWRTQRLFELGPTGVRAMKARPRRRERDPQGAGLCRAEKTPGYLELVTSRKHAPGPTLLLGACLTVGPVRCSRDDPASSAKHFGVHVPEVLLASSYRADLKVLRR